MVNHKCLKCYKYFDSPSKLERHKNKKIPCNESKKEYKCNICNVNFISPAQQKIHENTQKHLNNVIIEQNNMQKTELELENTINTNNQLENQLEKIKTLENELAYTSNKNTELETKLEHTINKNKQLEIELENEKNKNKKLETENKILKKNNKEKLIDEEQIYIIQERTFVELNLNVYKIGRTKNLNRRFKEYSNGSKLLFTIPCNNSVESETKILNYLKNNNEKYIQTKEYGNEYFRCNLNDLIQDIITNI